MGVYLETSYQEEENAISENKSLLENLIIQIPEDDGRVVNSLDSLDILKLELAIRFYSKKAKELEEKNFNINMVAYFHYLERSDKEGRLREKEKELFERLKTYLL